jgi:hypothetical protein
MIRIIEGDGERLAESIFELFRKFIKKQAKPLDFISLLQGCK